MKGLVEQARQVAGLAHEGQADKAGRPYLAHVQRVAFSLADDPLAEAVGWMHDALEDSKSIDPDSIRLHFPREVADALQLLTRRKDVPDADYYAAIRANPLALRVKLADIADNTDPMRLDLLPDELRFRLRRKYAEALEALTGGPDASQVGGSHYTDMAVQPWAAMESWMTPDQFRGFLLGSAIAYLARYNANAPGKGGTDDIRKARHYLDKLLEVTK